MALTRQQIRLAGCGIVAALSLAVLVLYRPSAWAGYVAWAVARIGGPLFVLCASVFIIGVVLVAFSRYRRKPELLAAALALSAALHLLLVATLTLWVIGEEKRPHTREVRLELALGLPSSIEDMLAREIREELLTPLVQDDKTMETEKPLPVEAEEPVAVPLVPAIDIPDREPSALAPEQAASASGRRVAAGETPAVPARVEADAEMAQIMKLRPVETAAEPEKAPPVEARQFESVRVEEQQTTLPTSAATVASPALPVPDRAVPMQPPKIEMVHAAPHQQPEQTEKRVEVLLDTVALDVGIMPEVRRASEVVEAAETVRTPSARVALEIAAPPLQKVDDTVLRPVQAAMTPLPLKAAAPQVILQELPELAHRERPDNPRLPTEPVRAETAGVSPLVKRAMQVETVALREAQERVLVPVDELSAARVEAVPAADARLQVEQPVLATGAAMGEPGESLAMLRQVPTARRGTEVPRIMDSASSESRPRAKADPADTVQMQMALLLSLAAPAGEGEPSTNMVQRELAAGRAPTESFPEQESSRRPAPGSASWRTTVRPLAEAQTLVEAPVQVAHRDAPNRTIAAADGMVGVRSSAQDTGAVIGISMRQAPVVAPVADGLAVVTHAPVTVAGVSRSAIGEKDTPVPLRPDAPLALAPSAMPADGPLARAALPGGATGRSTPEMTELGNTPVAAAGATDMESNVLMAGRVVAVDVMRSDAAADEKERQRVAVASAGALDVARAVQGDAALPAAGRLTVQAPLASLRTALVAPQMIPQELPGTSRRERSDDGLTLPREVAGVRVLMHDEEQVGGIIMRQAQMANVSSGASEAAASASRVAAPVSIAPVSRATVSEGGLAPSPALPDAPLMQGSSILPIEGSIAGSVRLSGVAGQLSPGLTEGISTVSTAPSAVDVIPELLVVGRMVAVAASQRDGSVAENGLARGTVVPAALRTAKQAAGAGTLGSAPVVEAPRPAMTVSSAPHRGGGTLADTVTAMPRAGSVAHGAAEEVASAQAHPIEDGGGVMALPMTAGTIARGSGNHDDGSTIAPARRTAAAFSGVARAPRPGEALEFTPQGGWKAPPPRVAAGRGYSSSGVRLAPEVKVVAGRRVETEKLQGGKAAAADAVRRLMVNDVARTTAIAGKKAIYELRSPEKRRLIEELGGSPETEAAVERALVWLAGAQSDDGHWDVIGFKGVEQCGGAGDRADGNVAVTGLSLLSYLGAGYTHMAGKHSETVRKGLDWLMAGQGRDGDLRRGGTMYDHAMATAALCESLSLTSDRRLVGSARLAAEFIMNAQTPEAAWRYEPRNDSDTSVLGWQILALKSAEIAGIEVSPKHFAWAGMWLDQVRKGDGGLYAYKPGHVPTPVMTAEGWFCQLFMGEEVRRQGQQESIAYLLENLPEWNEKGRSTVHLYYWYYATLAMRLSDVPEFDIWNKALKIALLAGHRRDGAAAGSWDPVCQLGPRGGRVYSTAMSALCLEVYYRYLPFYRRAATEP